MMRSRVVRGILGVVLLAGAFLMLCVGIGCYQTEMKCRMEEARRPLVSTTFYANNLQPPLERLPKQFIVPDWQAFTSMAKKAKQSWPCPTLDIEGWARRDSFSVFLEMPDSSQLFGQQIIRQPQQYYRLVETRVARDRVIMTWKYDPFYHTDSETGARPDYKFFAILSWIAAVILFGLGIWYSLRQPEG